MCGNKNCSCNTLNLCSQVCDPCKKQPKIYYCGEDISCVGVKKSEEIGAVVKKIGDKVCQIIQETSPTNSVEIEEATVEQCPLGGTVISVIEPGTGNVLSQAVVCNTVDLNTWDIPAVAFVATDGDDTTAVVGDGNKPYATITEAHTNAEIILIKAGNYTESVFLATDKHYHLMAGTTFTDGGFKDTPLTNTAKISGEGVFTGDALPILISNPGTKVDIQFDYVDNNDILFIIYGGTLALPNSLNLKCNSATVAGSNTGAFGSSSRDYSNTRVEIRDFYSSKYSHFFVRGSTSPTFNGTIYSECPTYILEDGGTQGTVNKNLLQIAHATEFRIDIKGDYVEKLGSDLSTTDLNSVFYLTNCTTPGSILNYQGNVKAKNQCMVANGFNYIRALGYFEGDFEVKKLLSTFLDTASKTIFQNATIHTTASSTISSAAIVHLNKCEVQSTAIPFPITHTSTSMVSQVYFHHVVFYLTGVASVFTIGTPLTLTTATVGSYANVALGATDVNTDFTVVSNTYMETKA